MKVARRRQGVAAFASIMFTGIGMVVACGSFGSEAEPPPGPDSAADARAPEDAGPSPTNPDGAVGADGGDDPSPLEDEDAGALPAAACQTDGTLFNESFDDGGLPPAFSIHVTAGGTLTPSRAFGEPPSSIEVTVDSRNDAKAYARRTLCNAVLGQGSVLVCTAKLKVTTTRADAAVLEVRGRRPDGKLVTARVKTNELQLSGAGDGGLFRASTLGEKMATTSVLTVRLTQGELQRSFGPLASLTIGLPIGELVLEELRIGIIYLPRAGAGTDPTSAGAVAFDDVRCSLEDDDR